MIKKELLEKVKQIEIQTRRVLSGFMSGDYRTKTRGFGFDFDQLRDYVQGDDIRFIDWKSSARTGKTLVRQYLEDKNRNVYVMVDVSRSVLFADKKDLISQIGAVLALAGFYNKDNVGLILFSNKILKFVPARANRQHVLKIIQDIFSEIPSIDSESDVTDISKVIKETMSRLKNNSIIFLISDFWDLDFNDSLKVFARHHDVIAISCYKDLEKILPKVGILEFEDLESSDRSVLNLSSRNAKRTNIFLKNFREDFVKFCKQNSIDILEINNDKDVISKLIELFQKRVTI